MNKEIPFGIGCFHFGINKPVPYSISWNEYKSELENSLNATQGISNVAIGDFSQRDFNIRVDDDLPDFGEGYHFMPRFEYTGLSFNLNIPLSEQNKIVAGAALPLSIFTENYRVYLFPTHYGLPVVFIELVDPSPNSSPSDAVFIVRKFLSQQINEQSKGFISFNSLGPSPFHADFFMEANDEIAEGQPFVVNENAVYGYRRIDIAFSSNDYDENEAMQIIFFDMTRELGLYYLIILLHGVQNRIWRDVYNDIAKLSNTLQSSYNKRIFFRPAKKVSELVSALASFEINKMKDADQIKDHYKYVFIGQTTFLKGYIDEEMNSQMTFPINQVTSLIQFINDSLKHKSTIMNNLFIGLFGGMVGSILTIIFSK